MSAFDLAQALETASKDLLDIQPSQAQSLVRDVSIHQVQDKKQGTTCYRCGSQRPPTGCQCKDYQCHYCGKTGHLQKVCHKKKNGHRKTQQQRLQKGQQHDLETKTFTVASDDGEPETEVLTMYPVKMTSVKPIWVSVVINGQSLDMELDTGASVSLICESTYFKLWNSNSRPTLKPSKVHLKTYTGSMVEVVGVLNVQASYEGQNKVVQLHVVKGDGPSLLGRDWLQSIKLNWAQINLV